MQKFNRIYEISIEADDQVRPAAEVTPENTKRVVFGLPYTIEFDIKRANLSSSQQATFRIYNLGEKTRKAIQKDQWQWILRNVQFRAGYESSDGKLLPLLFNGTIRTAYSYRQGVDFITEIDAYDGAWSMAEGYSSFALDGNKTAAKIIEELCIRLPNVAGVPAIGEFNNVYKRGVVLAGNTWNLIQRYSNQQALIDGGRVIALKMNEVLKGGLPLISAETGMLGIPRRGRSTLEVQMIFEPRLSLCQMTRLETTTLPEFNRPWKVIGVAHRGMISPSVSGDCITTATLWYTEIDFIEINALASL